jgi:hypothetical protein
MGFRIVGIVLLLLATGACVALGQRNRATATGIQGVVTVRPTHGGPIRAGSELSDPALLSNARFTVTSDNESATSFMTDAHGRFRVLLKPGHYVVALAENRFPRPCGPFEVDVLPGTMTDVQWRCDSGIR